MSFKIMVMVFCGLQLLFNYMVYQALYGGASEIQKQMIKKMIALALIPSIFYIIAGCINPGYSPIKQQTQQLHEQQEHSTQKFQHYITKVNRAGKHCHICHAPQYYRQKHCKQCNRCVFTFDHHCVFMGCIGEYNRPYFYIFLLALETQLSVIVCQLFIHMVTNHRGILETIVLSVILLIFGMVTILLIFQSYLMIKNMTTSEFFLGKKKLWYLKQIQEKRLKDRKGQNYFDRGILNNLFAYWGGLCRRRRIDWKKYIENN